jgi:hypothetical protein
MALPIRDGNQSLTTLSTILVSNSHIPAHTVISFGTQGITDIATAVSGVELGPNTLNALENITVTLGQVTITGGLTDAQLRASAVTISGGIYLSEAQVALGNNAPPEAVQIGGYNLADNKLYPIHVDQLGVQTIKGAVTASISGTPSVTFTQASVTFGTAVVTGSTSILNFPATQPVSIASVTIGNSVTIGSALPAGTNRIGSVTASISGTVPISISSVTVGNSVTIGSLPSISGTVTANLNQTNFYDVLNYYSSEGAGLPVRPDGDFAISGTVTANLGGGVVVTADNIGYPASKLVAGVYDIYGSQFGNNNPFPISGAIRNNGINNDPWVYIPRLTMSHPDLGNVVFDGYYRFDGLGGWGNNNINYGNVPYLTRALETDTYVFRLMVHDEGNDVEIEMASEGSSSPDFPTVMYSTNGTLVSGSLTFNTEQRESYGVRVTNSVTIGNSVTASISGTVTIFPVQGTSVTTSNFTSTTPSQTIASASSGREILTIFNEGAGNLHVCAGSTCTTIGYQVRLSSGDYWECPASQVKLIHTAVFATTGTARVTEIG